MLAPHVAEHLGLTEAAVLFSEANSQLGSDHYHPHNGYSAVRGELMPHRHNGYANFTYVDGHMKSTTLDATWRPVNQHFPDAARRKLTK